MNHKELPVNIGDVRIKYFLEDGRIPNSNLPVLIYPRAIMFSTSDPLIQRAQVEFLVNRNGWYIEESGQIDPRTHLHSTSHELLLIQRGRVELSIGGDLIGRRHSYGAGDALIFPAGVGHRQVFASDNFSAFVICPNDQSRDLILANQTDLASARRNIAQLSLPTTDPLHGQSGPLVEYWHRRSY